MDVVEVQGFFSVDSADEKRAAYANSKILAGVSEDLLAACSVYAEVAVVVVEYFVELIVELGVEIVDELVVDMLVGCCWWVRQVATVWYPLTVVQS